MSKYSTYVWIQEPWLSASPIERIKHSIYRGEKGELDEVAVYKLENEKYLYIRYCGNEKMIETENGDIGFTDSEEFDSLEEAISLYEMIQYKEGDANA
jgi:CRISPR/Cas system-associated endoribonuclease Cas2